MKERKRILSVTAADLRWDVFRGSGDGGQKKQKTSSGVRCTHEPSGAVGHATDSRMQSQNRKTAFERMVSTAEFKAWLELEIDQKLGRVKTEVSDGKGGWTEGEPR